MRIITRQDAGEFFTATFAPNPEKSYLSPYARDLAGYLESGLEETHASEG